MSTVDLNETIMSCFSAAIGPALRHLSRHDKLAIASAPDFASLVLSLVEKLPAYSPPDTSELQAFGLQTLGTKRKMNAWMVTPLAALGHQTPLVVSRTPEGVERVMNALREIANSVGTEA